MSGNCGAYADSDITQSDGYNTYVANNMWGCGSIQPPAAGAACGVQTVTADNPGDWSVTSDQAAGNTGVLTYPDIAQIYTDASNNNSPVSSYSSITSSFSESMPHNSGTIAEAGYDIWTSYSSDIMIWVDNVNRGTGGATKIGTATLGGQDFTVYLYGGKGGEIIFSLDGSGGTGTFANETSGSVDILGAMKWVEDNGYASNLTLGQVDFGWEICSTGGVPETFTVSQYGLKSSA